MALKLRGRTFRPALWAFLLTLSAAAAAIALGNWQWHRAGERRALAAQYDAGLHAPALELPAAPINAIDVIGKRVAARGRFDAGRTVYLEYKLRRGRVGYEVVTPLRLGASAMHVLVNRGWVPAETTPGAVPQIRTPTGELRIEGLALARLPQVLQAGTAAPHDRVRQNLRIEEFSAQTGLALQPVVIEQLSESGDGLERDWPRADLGAQKNEMYAMQWYSLAALAVVLFLVLSFRREPPAA